MSDTKRYDVFAADLDAPVSPAELDAAYADFAADLERYEQQARELDAAINAGDYSQLGAYSAALQKRATLQATLKQIDALRRPPPPLTPLEQAAAEWAGLTPEQYAELKGRRS
jgi:hypothetical protein